MSARAFFLPTFVLLLAGGCAAPGPEAAAEAVEPERERLLERQDAFLSALDAGDVAATVEHFAADAVLHVGGMPPVEGRDAIGAFYGNVFRFMTASAAVPETTRISSGGDMAFSRGSVSNTFQGEGSPMEFSGKYVLVWEIRGEGWSIVVYAVSDDAPDSGP